ncbi:hypothetical protein GCM10019059_44620 [Camelimonas fluminis]|nr:hypothetical protein GCM10019059_44620 [Camelimonas fluminis]
MASFGSGTFGSENCSVLTFVTFVFLNIAWFIVAAIRERAGGKGIFEEQRVWL